MYNKIKLTFLAACLVGGVAQASPACDGFEIKIKNKLADKLLLSTSHINGAELQPGGIQAIDAGKEQVFTVNESSNDMSMIGEFVFHTISLPSKKLKIRFSLKNSGPVCSHQDESPKSDYNLDKTRLPGKVKYSINNK